jgi:phage tail sheath protein FI
MRLVNYVKRNVKKIADQYLFRLTNPTTWAAISRDLNNFLNNVQTRGGISAKSVQFDATTNTPAYQDANIMYGRISITPVHVAERIFIDLTIDNTGSTVTGG